MLQWGIRQSTETENLMTSVERLMEYTRLDDEIKTGKKDPKWPKEWIFEKLHRLLMIFPTP